MPPMGHNHLGADDIQGKVYDAKLFKRMLVYLKPYWKYVVVSIFTMLLISAFELIIPYITKIVVDKYIVSDRNLIHFENQNTLNEYLIKYPQLKKLDIFDYNNSYYLFLSSKQRYNFDKDVLTDFEQKNLLTKSKVFLIDYSPKHMEIFEGKEIFRINENLLAVQTDDYNSIKEKLDSSTKKSIRAYAYKELKKYGFLYFGIILLRFLLLYLQIYIIVYAAQHAMYDLRRDVFAHLEKMPLSYFDKNPVGRLVTRITNDVRTLDEMLTSGLVGLIQDLLVLFGIIFMMLFIHVRLALVSFITLPFVILMMIIFKTKLRKAYRLLRIRISALNTSLSEDIQGVKIVQIFNQYKTKCDAFAENNLKHYKAAIAQMHIFAFFRPLINVTRFFATALIIWYGGGQIMQNLVSLGVFLAFMRYMERFFRPINRLSEKFNVLQAAMSGAERIFDVLDSDPEDYRNESINNTSFDGEIEFKNVWLAYKENENVLKDISFKVNPGEKIALVGHTGSGKTSIVNLILGMYPYQKGQISIDNKDLSEYSLKDIRNNVGMVQQDVFLFSGNIKENIVLDNASITDQEVKKVGEYVNVDNFVQTLPEKYYETVTERGSTFSVGQRQLIAFARVLAYNPSIFILDEATSNIDTETEILIQDALEKLMENRTSIIIAHRLSTIKNVDRIIVLHKGEIVEEGTHDELLNNNGVYYDLYRLQYESRLGS